MPQRNPPLRFYIRPGMFIVPYSPQEGGGDLFIWEDFQVVQMGKEEKGRERRKWRKRDEKTKREKKKGRKRDRRG